MNATTFIIAAAVLLVTGGGVVYQRQQARRRIRQEVQRAQQAYRLATEMASEGFYVVRPVADADGSAADWLFTDCNEQGAAYFGLQKQDVIGKKLSSLCSNSAYSRILSLFEKALQEGYYEYQYEKRPGSPLNIPWAHCKLIASKAGLAISLRDISGEKFQALELSRLAHEDAITALPNRKWLAETLPGMLRDARSKIGLLFIDLDDFKNVNEALGHPVGDLLLRAAATRLKSIIGKDDKVVRMGGDEFAIVLTGLNQNSEAARVAELVNEILRFPLELVKGKRSITTSIGISMYPDDGADIDTLLKCAEIAMYSAKNNGKAHHCFYTPALYETLQGKLTLEQELAEAIEKDQFELHYEPRINVMTGKLCGMEALVRWRHPVRGLVPPLEFIPLAESTGLILKLGDLIIEKAFRQIAAWTRDGLSTVPMSINISAHQFNKGTLSQTILNALNRYRVQPKFVEVELTESAMLGEQSTIQAELSSIRSLGIRLLIDDFGTGYSSLSQLQRLQMDVLKVDRAFLSQLEKTGESQIFVKAIISMAHALGLRVIAEGVETKAQLDILRALSCDEAQGYYLSRPLQAEQMTQVLTSGELPRHDTVERPLIQLQQL